MAKTRICIECGTSTVKNPNKDWFAGPLCRNCHDRLKYNEPNSRKKTYEKQYRQDNKNIISTKAAVYVKEKSKTDEQFRLKRILRRRLSEAVKNNQKSGSAVTDLGCTIEELKKHLEFKFQLGMSWNNYGNGKGKWNIDHIVPLSSIDLTNRDEFLKACHYTNLQPLWWQDNLKKSDKI